MSVRLIKSFGFEAAHWLPTFPEGHKCRRMHGHSFRIDVAVEGEIDPESGYLVDYGEIAAVVEPLCKQLDHRCLNDIEGLENPTSEVLAKWLWDRLEASLPMLAEVIVQETCTARCEYRPSEA
jgi:6-pyruvoyltetrahydropterin/6-carboxytetrahydropterin synthase